MMRAENVFRRMAVRAGLMAIALVTLATAACVASAGAATLAAPTVSPSVPEQGIAAQLAFSGTADSGLTSQIFAVARPAGGPACQTTFAADQKAASSSQIIADATINPTNAQPGAVAATVGWQPNELPGSVIVCSWLVQGTGATEVDTPAPALTVTVGGPQATAAIVLAGTPVAGVPFAMRLTTQTDQPLAVSAVFHNPTQSCSGSFEADREAFPTARKILAAQAIPAGQTLSVPTASLPAGTYVICTWIEGPLGDEVDYAGVTTPFTIGSPTTAAAKADPTLAISSLTASAAQGVHVSGTTAPGYVGTLTVKATCGKGSSGSASASGGHYSAVLALPSKCTSGDQLTVTVSSLKSAAFEPGLTSNTTLVAGSASAPASHTTPPPTAFSIIQRQNQSVKNVFLTRPGTILIASSLHLTLSLHWTRWTAGMGQATGTARAAQARPYRVNVTASHLVDGTFACLAISHRVSGRLQTVHLGLGREGRGLLWMPVRQLHARNSRASVYGAPHGCPVPKG